MTRPFEPRDALLLRSLQGKGISLDLETEILSDASPLRLALGALWPFALWPFVRSRAITVLTSRDAATSRGFVQARIRKTGLAADITYAAPPLSGLNGAALVWQRLLNGLTAVAGEAGAMRIFAAVAEDDQVALHVFRQAGFTVYTTDTVFRLPQGSAADSDLSREIGAGSGERVATPAKPEHEAEITSLYMRSLPEAALAHESPDGSGWRCYPLGGWRGGWGSGRGWQVSLEATGRVSAAWRIYSGPGGRWLHMVTDPQVGALESVNLAVAGAGSSDTKPVFCAARGHEAQLNLALREAGFEPVVGRFRLVKHTTARILEPAWRSEAVAERRLKAAPTRASAPPMMNTSADADYG